MKTHNVLDEIGLRVLSASGYASRSSSGIKNDTRGIVRLYGLNINRV